ncbi:hypothetical protein AXF42_Ash007648 [Apostasia shenzhenica]|uniref:Uncharacterized protein n=1 Tax=Apostasia shenzhenica TaxID=1088818 RepID=A0A2I0A635_9ASPA|nr:hypothetical protein AXF42_Ash007648 [Apostasia shenzhenica]
MGDSVFWVSRLRKDPTLVERLATDHRTCLIGNLSKTQQHLSFTAKPAVVPISVASLQSTAFSHGFSAAKRLKFSSAYQRYSFETHVKAASESGASSLTSDAGSSGTASLGGPVDNHNQKSTFPNGFKVVRRGSPKSTVRPSLREIYRVGDFEMHLRRNIGSKKAVESAASHIVSPTTAPPIPSKPMSESSPATQPSTPPPPPNSSSAPSSPFVYVSSVKASKLAALEASGLSGYALVSSPTVGSFRSGRTVKGKKQAASCKENKNSFLTLIVLFGAEPVGYGDPLVAVLPSFHGINHPITKRPRPSRDHMHGVNVSAHQNLKA